MLDDEDDLAMVNSVIDLAHAFKRKKSWRKAWWSRLNRRTECYR
jgi:hypothetical protein